MNTHEAGHMNPSAGLESRLEALERAHRRLTARMTRMEHIMATTQADLDAVAANLGDLKTSLTAADAGIQAEVTALEAQAAAAGVTLDMTGVNAALADLGSQVDATSALVPAAPPAAG